MCKKGITKHVSRGKGQDYDDGDRTSDHDTY